MPNPPKHIAVFRLSAMGDVAMTVPVLRALVTQNPEINITFVSRPFYKPFFSNIPNVTFYEIDLKKRHKGFFGLLRLFFDLKKLKINAFADLHNVLRSKIVRTLFQLSGIKTAFTNKGRKEKKALTSSKNKVFKPLKTMVERHVETFKKLGISIDVSKTTFPEKSVLSQKIRAIIDFDPSQNLIGIAPFAQYESKVYPKDLMQKVIDELAKKPNNKILLFGSNQEMEQLNQFINQNNKETKNIIVVASKLSFYEELQLLSNLKVILSMDSGNAHIAAMLGVNVVTLWGATHPFAGFSPFNQPLENCLLSDRNQFPLLPTSIYGNKKVAGYEDVMRTIVPENVVNKVNAFLKG